MFIVAARSETAYAILLEDLWEELEVLLETYYGRRPVGTEGVDRLRLRLAEYRHRVAALADPDGTTLKQAGPGRTQAASLSAFAAELLRLLDDDCLDDAFDLACGTTMIRAQNRILDEVQRVAVNRR